MITRNRPLSWLLHGWILALAACAGAPAGEAQRIPHTADPVVVDGALAEPIWEKAPTHRVAYPHGGSTEAVEKSIMRVRYAWDDHYLYIGYEVFDENLVAVGTDHDTGPKGNRREGLEIAHKEHKADVAELFISFGDKHFFWELHHNAANQFNDVWCMVADSEWPIADAAMVRGNGLHLHPGAYLKDRDAKGGAPARRFAKAVRRKAQADGSPSTVNHAGDTDTGYTAELRLPLFGVGAPRAARPTEKKNGKGNRPGPWRMGEEEVRILAVYQNGDLDQRYHHSSPQGVGGFFHTSWDHWPVYTFEGPSADDG
jgi:hypothetical protein